MKLTPPSRRQVRKGVIAFTMVEVALSLAIIAFALVAIIGVLPTGMQVQRDNREETIIGNDAAFLLDVVRNGNTNANAYVLADRINWITNTFTDASSSNAVGFRNGYSNQSELVFNIVGLMGVPKFENGGTNRIVAQFRANNGPLVQQSTNPADIAFTYQVISELVPFATGVSDTNLVNNLWDLRLLFQWPVYPNNAVGNNHKVYRALVSGRKMTNGVYTFFQPASYQNR